MPCTPRPRRSNAGDDAAGKGRSSTGRVAPRVAIFDFDLHWGNGTQEIIESGELSKPPYKGRVGYFSVHQYGQDLYPFSTDDNSMRDGWIFGEGPVLRRNTSTTKVLVASLSV